MEISNYQPSKIPPIYNSIIQELFSDRVHRRFTIDKSDFAFCTEPTLRKQPSQFSHLSSQMQEEDKVLLESKSGAAAVVKRKMIRRQMGRHSIVGDQKRIHEKYCVYLLNYMHKINLQLIRKGVPPGLSVLETVDEGDYVQSEDATHYVRKDYPHYSNTIKLHQLPQPTGQRFLMQPQRIRREELYFQMEDNCVVKVKQVGQFVSILFSRSILFSKKSRMRLAPQENENHDFDLIGQQMGIHFRTVKLLYDLLNEYFDLESEMESYPEAYSRKHEESKAKAASEIKLSLADILDKHRVNEALHIPQGELFISLRQLRQLLHEKMMAQRDNE